MRRDRDGSDDVSHGAVKEELSVEIGNARLLDQSERRKVEIHGFELLHQPLQRHHLDFFDHHQVVKKYYPECAEIIKQSTNASCVLAFDHNIRWAAGKVSNKRITDGQKVQGPVYGVHGDYTLVSAPQRLRDLASPPGVNDTLRAVLKEGETLLTSDVVNQTLDENKRFAIINVWRNIDR